MQRRGASIEDERFRRTFEKHGRYVCRRLRLLAVAESDLDDVLQEVFLVVFQRLSDYEERGRIRGWLNSITSRIVWARRRKQRRHFENAAGFPQPVFAPTQHDRVVEDEALALGHRLLEALPPEQRDVFWLYEVEDLSMSEIARSIGCPLQTAYSRLHKARERILAAAKLAEAKQTEHDTESRLGPGSRQTPGLIHALRLRAESTDKRSGTLGHGP